METAAMWSVNHKTSGGSSLHMLTLNKSLWYCTSYSWQHKTNRWCNQSQSWLWVIEHGFSASECSLIEVWSCQRVLSYVNHVAFNSRSVNIWCDRQCIKATWSSPAVCSNYICEVIAFTPISERMWSRTPVGPPSDSFLNMCLKQFKHHDASERADLFSSLFSRLWLFLNDSWDVINIQRRETVHNNSQNCIMIGSNDIFFLLGFDTSQCLDIIFWKLRIFLSRDFLMFSDSIESHLKCESIWF